MMFGEVRVVIDGAIHSARQGDSIAAHFLRGGRRAWRRTTAGEPRGLFCGIGTCFECTVTVDGTPHVRACLTPVVDGMTIDTGEVPHAG